jgi:DNA-binding IclR family transcriptional regulator
MTGARSEPGRTVTNKVVGILQAFSGASRQLSLSEISDHAGLPRPTALRLVRELVASDLLERTSTGRYRIGISLWQAGERSMRVQRLRECARPAMMDLCTSSEIGTLVTIFTGRKAIVVEKMGLTRNWPSGRWPSVADALPLHASAAGKLLLAAMPVVERDRFLLGVLPRFTSQTIVRAESLLPQIETISREGFSVSAGELGKDLSSIAAYIRSSNGTVIGSLVMAAPSSAFIVRKMREPLQRAIASIGRRLEAPLAF